MNGKINLSTAELSVWVKKTIEGTRKSAADVLNNAAGDVALRAVDNTARANYAQMVKLMKRGGNFGKMLKSGRRSKGKSARYQTFNPSGYVYAVLNFYKKVGKMPSWAIGEMPKKLVGAPVTKDVAIQYVNAKLRSIGYIAVGFVMAAKFFGKPITTKISRQGYAAASTGRKATPDNLTAKIMNFSREAGGKARIPAGVETALRRALDSVIDDMKKHLTAKIQKVGQAARRP